MDYSRINSSNSLNTYNSLHYNILIDKHQVNNE